VSTLKGRVAEGIAVAAIAVIISGCAATPEAPASRPTTVPSPLAVPRGSSAADSGAEVVATFDSEQQAKYEETVASFPFAMPPGHAFPTHRPDVRYWSRVADPRNPAVSAAYLYWRCAVTHTARAAFVEGDYAGADAYLAQLSQISDDILKDNSNSWTHRVDFGHPGGVFPLEGPSGECYFWDPASFT
jgi:hypothetical protein